MGGAVARAVGRAQGVAARVPLATEHRRVIKAALLVGTLTFGVRIAGLLRDMYVAAELGTGGAFEAYVVALAIPTFVATIAGDAAAGALLPQIAQARAKRGEEAAQAVFAEMMVVAVGMMIVATAILAATPRLLLPLLASGFDQEKIDLTVQLWMISLPVLLLVGAGTLWSGMLNSNDRFGLAAIAPLMVPIAGGGALLIAPHWHAYSLSVGFVVGTLLQTAIIGWGVRRQGIRLRPAWHGLLPETRVALRQFLPLAANNVVFNALPVVDQAMAATLGDRSVGILTYGSKIVLPLLAVSSLALSTAAFPYLTRLVAEDDWHGLRKTMRTYTALIFGVAVPGVILLALASEPIVRILFERGEFTARDTTDVARVQAMLALMIPFATVGALYSRILISAGAGRLLMYASTFVFFLNLVGDYVLKGWIGVEGIALASVVNYIVQAAFLTLAIRSVWRKKLTAS